MLHLILRAPNDRFKDSGGVLPHMTVLHVQPMSAGRRCSEMHAGLLGTAAKSPWWQ